MLCLIKTLKENNVAKRVKKQIFGILPEELQTAI